MVLEHLDILCFICFIGGLRRTHILASTIWQCPAKEVPRRLYSGLQKAIRKYFALSSLWKQQFRATGSKYEGHLPQKASKFLPLPVSTQEKHGKRPLCETTFEILCGNHCWKLALSLLPLAVLASTSWNQKYHHFQGYGSKYSQNAVALEKPKLKWLALDVIRLGGKINRKALWADRRFLARWHTVPIAYQPYIIRK